MLTLLRFLFISGAVYVLICALMFLLQKKLVYFPGPKPTITPERFGLEFREVSLRTKDDVAIHAWYFPVEGAEYVVLMCHGNAGNIEGRIPAAAALAAKGHAMLLFDYRGYGNSEGRPSEEGTYLDGEAAYDWVVAEAHAMQMS